MYVIYLFIIDEIFDLFGKIFIKFGLSFYKFRFIGSFILFVFYFGVSR